MITVTMTYQADGKVCSNEINYDGELIYVHPNPKNAPTREFRRTDEIVQALVQSKK